MSTRTAHPEITSLIRKRDSIHELMLSKYFSQAIYGLLLLFFELEPADKKVHTKIINEIKDEWTIINLTKSQTTVKKRMIDRQLKYFEWYEKINDILWNGGYLASNKYGGDITDEELEGAEEQ